MYKLVIFDMDGTIMDTDLMVVEAWLRLYKKYRPGFIPHITDLLAFSGPSIQVSLKKEFPNLDQAMLLKDFAEISQEVYPLTVTPYPGCRDAIEELKKKGIKVSTNTNKMRPFALYALTLTHLDNLFDSVVAGGDVPNFKPAPDGIYEAMRLAGINDKKDVLYIGDTIYDYETASNAGVDTMLVTWVPRKLPSTVHPKYFLNSYAELGGFFDEKN